MSRYKGMTAKQLKFAQLYLELDNASEAYRRVYSVTEKSTKLVSSKIVWLMSNPAVKKYIDDERAKVEKEALKNCKVTRERIVEELASIAFARSEDYFTVDLEGNPKLKDLSKLSKRQLSALEIKQTPRGFTIGISTSDKLAALQMLGKMDDIAMFVDRQKITIENEFDEMTDDELAEFVGEGGARPVIHAGTQAVN